MHTAIHTQKQKPQKGLTTTIGNFVEKYKYSLLYTSHVRCYKNDMTTIKVNLEKFQTFILVIVDVVYSQLIKVLLMKFVFMIAAWIDFCVIFC